MIPSDHSSGNSKRSVATDKNLILFVICISLFFLTYQFSAVNVALPAIGQEFNPDAILLGWISTAPILASGVLLIPLGRLSDILGIKKMFILGMSLYTLVSLASAFANSASMLIILRVLIGLGTAMSTGNAMAITTASFPQGERGRALGISSACVYFGLSVGPFLGGILTEHLGWRSLFLISVPCTLAAVIIFMWKIKSEWRGSPNARYDYAGSFVFILTFTALLYGFSVLPEWYGLALIPVGILGLFGFVKMESRVPSPLVDINVFRNNRTFIMSNLASLINYAATYAIIFLMSLYLQYIQGLSAGTAGLILIAQPGIQACISPLSGRLSDKFEPQVVSSVGMAITCIGLVLFAFIDAATPVPWVIGILLIVGIGVALFVSPNTNAIMSSVHPQHWGIASAMSNTMRQIGQMFSMGIVMIILSFFVGKVSITPESYPAFLTAVRVAFIIFAVLCFAGIFASISRGKVH
jgi:EmrB/QacA subfamily drug resistance transporter